MTETSVAFNDGSALVKCHSYCKSWQCGSWAAWTTAEPWSCSSSVELSHHSFSVYAFASFSDMSKCLLWKRSVSLYVPITQPSHILLTSFVTSSLAPAGRRGWKSSYCPAPQTKPVYISKLPSFNLFTQKTLLPFSGVEDSHSIHISNYLFFYWKTAWHLLKIQQILLKKRTSEEAISAIISSSLSFSPRSPVSRNPDNRSQAVKKITSMIYNIADMFGCMRQKTCTVAYLGHSHQRVHPYMLSVS